MGSSARRKSISSRLRRARQRAGLSARGLDILANLGRGHTALIESGERVNLETNTLRGLVSVLGISLDWLVNGEGLEPTAEQIQSAVARAKGAATGTDG